MAKKNSAIQQVTGKPMNPPSDRSGAKRRRTRKKKSNGGRVERPMSMHLNGAAKKAVCNYVCSRVDPFCLAACGAKRADGGAPSIARTFRQFGYVAQYPTGSGIGGTQFKASLLETLRIAYTGSFGAWSAWSNVVGYSTSNYDRYRITSMGIHAYTIASPTASQGISGVFTHRGSIPAVLAVTGTLSADTTRFPSYEFEVNHTFKGIGPETEDYVAINATSVPGWSSATLFFDGATAVNDQKHIAYDLIMNVELLAKEESGYVEFATPTPPRIDMLEQIAINVEKIIPDTTYSTPDKHSATVLNTVGDAVEAFARVVGPYALEGLAGMLLL